MIIKRTIGSFEPKTAFTMLALLAALGGALFISFRTSYTRQKGPRYTGEAGDSLRSFRLDKVDSIVRFTIAPDGKRLNILCRKNGQWVLCVKIDGMHRDGIRTNYTDSINLDPEIVLSPDSASVGIVYQRASRWRGSDSQPVRGDKGGQWFVSINHHFFGGFDSDFKPKPLFSPDGTKFGFPYKKLGQYYVQVVDTTFGPYDRADMAITKEGEIILGYIKQDRAYIESVFRPGQR